MAQKNDDKLNEFSDLEQLLYLASHEMQEPMRKITGYSEMLRKDLEAGKKSRVEEDLQFIESSAERMQEMIDSLLSLSKVTQKSVEKTAIKPFEVIQLVVEDMHKLLRDENAEIDISELKNISPVIVNKGQLIQLYENLISNAIKYNESDNIRIICTAEENKETVTLGVKDTGFGIEEKYQEQIFQPFERLHSRRDFAGSGFGLAICKKIVESHGSRLELDSTPGVGSHFYFELKKAV